ncbi:hypothetical protein KC845_03735 [Candidatus Kaiserbacteria bacterium]|nr:hypothetical protein [Candidatus Kaiserbacteria bacterium]
MKKASHVQPQYPPRSTFPAGNDIEVRFSRHDDNQHVAVDVWAIKVGEKFFTANLICPYSAPEGALWLIGSIARPNGDHVWGFRDDMRVQAGFTGLIYLVDFENTTCLVFQSKGAEPKVVHAVPLVDLLLEQGPQRPLTEVIARKCGVANLLKLGVHYTSTEQIVMKHLAEQRRQAEEAEREAERQRKLAERKAKIDAMLAREQLTVAANGRQITAIWVVDDEWKILPPKTIVIAGSFHDDGKFYPEETFQVFKERGKEAQKRHPAAVGTDRRLASSAQGLPAPTTTKVVMIDGNPFEVPTFASCDDLERHRTAGLNSGALRGVESSGKFQLFRVTSDKLAPVNAFELLG